MGLEDNGGGEEPCATKSSQCPSIEFMAILDSYPSNTEVRSC